MSLDICIITDEIETKKILIIINRIHLKYIIIIIKISK